MQPEYIKYYDLENYILNDVRTKFLNDKFLNSFDFFLHYNMEGKQS
jgi:hypothetical protein